MADWKFDSTQKGLRTVFFDYEIESLCYLWSKNGEYASSREVWDNVTKKLPISRASIINSLNRMAEFGVLLSKETTGKGGHRGLYSAAMNENELKKHIADELIKSIRNNLG